MVFVLDEMSGQQAISRLATDELRMWPNCCHSVATHTRLDSLQITKQYNFYEEKEKRNIINSSIKISKEKVKEFFLIKLLTFYNSNN